MSSEVLNISWQDYLHLIEDLAKQIDKSGWDFDVVLALARGGLQAGDILSRLWKKPFAVLCCHSYQENQGTTQGQLQLAQHISIPDPEGLRGRILVVDDLVDSGNTLSAVLFKLEHLPHIQEIKTAVLWQKPKAKIHPDFVASYLSTNPWIIQPFEIYDTLSLKDLNPNDKKN
jgi:hypoxanthine phosphoribosyltransferase